MGSALSGEHWDSAFEMPAGGGCQASSCRYGPMLSTEVQAVSPASGGKTEPQGPVWEESEEKRRMWYESKHSKGNAGRTRQCVRRRMHHDPVC